MKEQRKKRYNPELEEKETKQKLNNNSEQTKEKKEHPILKKAIIIVFFMLITIIIYISSIEHMFINIKEYKFIPYFISFEELYTYRSIVSVFNNSIINFDKIFNEYILRN